MKKIFFIFAFFILSFNLISSLELTPEILTSVGCQGLIQFGPEIVGKSIPEKVPFENEIANVYINGSIFGHVVLEKKFITDVSCDENLDSTYDIYIQNYQTLFDIMNGEDSIQTLKEKLGNKEIEIKGKTLGKKIKFFFLKIGLKFI